MTSDKVKTMTGDKVKTRTSDKVLVTMQVVVSLLNPLAIGSELGNLTNDHVRFALLKAFVQSPL